MDLVLYHHNHTKSNYPDLCSILKKADHHSASEREDIDDTQEVNKTPLISLFSKIVLEGNDKVDEQYIPLNKLSLDDGSFNNLKPAAKKDTMGGWNYKSEFKHSNYMANSETRCRKAEYNMDNSIRASQGAVWDSIEDLQVKRNSFSKTSALRDNYEKIEKTNDDYLKHFGIYENQVGVIARLENKVGLDVFANHSLYEQYSDMILKSYIIDDVGNNSLIKDDFDFEAVLDNINEKYFNKRNTVGLGQSYFIKTNNGSGTSLIYENELIHANFFYNNRLRNLKL